jgi:hypothetical protein
MKLWEAISSPANFPNYDARTGLGYGTQSGFHKNRQYQSSFPYIEEDDEEYDGEVIDDEMSTKIQNKVGSRTVNDPLATRKSDPFYFVGAATPLNIGEAYGGPNRSKTSIVPNIPGGKLYPQIQAVLGSGGTAINRVYKPIQGTNSTAQGFSKAPKPTEPSEDQLRDEATDHIRELTRMIVQYNNLKEFNRR